MKIAFVSCSNVIWQKNNQPIWGIIHGQKPDLLLLLGDNVYIGDIPFDADVLEEKYKQQLAETHFNKLLCDIPYLAVWDNHDFGTNALFSNDLTTAQKRQSRDLFDRYLKNRSIRPDSEHVYCSYDYNKNGTNVRVIMLDVRSHQRDPNSGSNATLLGETQENWLLEKMRTSMGITVICSGFSYSIGASMNWKLHKKWADTFTKAVAHTSKPLFLGGNNHTNEFIIHELEEDPVISFPPVNPFGRKKFFYEAISSSVGRNHDSDGNDDEYNLNDLYVNRPHNKYGIVNITPGEVEIVLYSQIPGKFYHRVIDVNTWKLKKENKLIVHPV
jgi:hypothetical protein